MQGGISWILVNRVRSTVQSSSQREKKSKKRMGERTERCGISQFLQREEITNSVTKTETVTWRESLS